MQEVHINIYKGIRWWNCFCIHTAVAFTPSDIEFTFTNFIDETPSKRIKGCICCPKDTFTFDQWHHSHSLVIGKIPNNHEIFTSKVCYIKKHINEYFTIYPYHVLNLNCWDFTANCINMLFPSMLCADILHLICKENDQVHGLYGGFTVFWFTFLRKLFCWVQKLWN